ncbi:S-layer protein [Candidatus Magnetoovum chiemensis]|nr:S-layer protein [Candidatus Magnetoovum chiemensis]
MSANTGVSRTGTITIAGQTFTVTQAEGCTYSISPTSAASVSDGGTGSVAVTASDGACAWTAASNDSWLTVDSGASGTGSGTVNYTVSANTDSALRTGSITVGDKTFTIKQAGAFNDVPNDWTKSYIENMYSHEITSGCGDGNYCPDNNVTRAEMAIFIVRAMVNKGLITITNGIDDFTYETTPYFTDAASDHWAFKWIQKFKETGVTSGCTATEFCPDNQVTRTEMAIFIVKALYGSDFTCSGGVDCATTTPIFTDVPSEHWAFKYVQKFYETGITSGCGDGIFCADSNTLRSQMAVFLTKGFLQ